MKNIVSGKSSHPTSIPIATTKKVVSLLITTVVVIGIILWSRQEQKVVKNNLEYIPVELVSIADGDTLSVIYQGKKETVRIIGIDTPEKAGPFTEYECFGDEATVALTTLLEGEDLFITLDPTQDMRDRYDRLLAHLYIGLRVDTDNPQFLHVGEQMAKSGFARSYVYEIPSLYYYEIHEAEETAKLENVGMWRSCQQ